MRRKTVVYSGYQGKICADKHGRTFPVGNRTIVKVFAGSERRLDTIQRRRAGQEQDLGDLM
jgi:hypothetical protein